MRGRVHFFLLFVPVVNNANRVWRDMKECLACFLVKQCLLLYLYAGNGASCHRYAWRNRHIPKVSFWSRCPNNTCTFTDESHRRQFLHPARWEEIRTTWFYYTIPTVVEELAKFDRNWRIVGAVTKLSYRKDKTVSRRWRVASFAFLASAPDVSIHNREFVSAEP